MPQLTAGLKACSTPCEPCYRKKEPEPPAHDPYAYVTAPRKPRPSGRSAAAVAEIPEE